MSVLVIGAGGWVGSAVCASAAADGLQVHGLTRRPAPHLEAHAKVHVGDARRNFLGLDEDEAEQLADEVTSVVVSVGSFDLSVPLAKAQSEHVVPLRGALRFAKSCTQLKNVVLVSSLLATGDVRQRMRSDYDPDHGKQRNFYEWAKIQGERVARGSGLPVDIVRAGHVLAGSDELARPAKPQAVFELLRVLFAGWPLPVMGSNRYWSLPSDFCAQVVLDRVKHGTGGSSVWAVDPASPTLAEILDLVNVKYGARAKRIRHHGLARSLAAVVRPHWLDLPMEREVFDYCTAHWDLELSCLNELVDAGRVTVPADRGYLVRTLDQEIARLRELP
ncbi:SDR family oxidoreductase [Amycolatopsis nigrescens]|uniref:SDR family oxidoreductase n=1 Tax=Amycolatopsis nigrescens TaxID=381445 RepID=UPI0003AA1A30|nr:NAD(P)-dependent oxidoreductase [Amycolatopsis nigrescens]